MKTLHAYQQRAKSHIINNPYCGLFMEMGLGKTVTTLSAIDVLMFDTLEVSSVLVVAPKNIIENVWEEECQEWLHLRGVKFSKIIGTKKQRLKALEKKAHIYLISIDNVSWLCRQYSHNLPYDMLVIDELSAFKNHRAKRFLDLKRCRPLIKRVVGLTGTPVPNGLLDLWSQVYLLDRGERLGKAIGIYRREYFTADKVNGHVVYSYRLADPENEKKIHNRLKDICLSMKSKDYLDLPDKIERVSKLSFTEETKEKYKQFKTDLVLELLNSEEDISVTNAAALSNKLCQFCNGAVYDESGEYHTIHDLKLEQTKSIIEFINKPVIIAYSFKHDLERLQKYLEEYEPRTLKSSKDVSDWNAKKIRVLLLHPASAGHGLNLQAGGNYIIWFGQTWSLELEQQLNARLHRQGQSEKVFIYKIVIKGTIDEQIIKAQKSKENVQESLMASIKTFVKNYKNYEQ